jgi:hypothetical protein
MKQILSIFLFILLGMLSSCSKQDASSKKVTSTELPPAIQKMISEVDCEAANRSCGYVLYLYELNGRNVYVTAIDNSLSNGVFCCGSAGDYYDEEGVFHTFIPGEDGKDFAASARLIGEAWKCSDLNKSID